MEPKFCVDCKWYKRTRILGVQLGSRCVHLNNLHLVYKIPAFLPETLRTQFQNIDIENRICGPSGKWWEEAK